MTGPSALLNIFHLTLSTILLSLFFAAGMAIMLVPLGLLIDLRDASRGHPGLLVMSGIAGIAGLAFGLGMAWYARYLDSRIPLPDLTSGETIQFRQFGYAISPTKYDPARIIITNRRLFVQPIRFNPGGQVPPLEAPLSDVAAAKSRAFGKHLSRSFRLMAIRQKIVFSAAGRQIGYMANLGYPLPPLRLFPRHGTTTSVGRGLAMAETLAHRRGVCSARDDR